MEACREQGVLVLSERIAGQPETMAAVCLPRCVGACVGADIVCAVLAADLPGGGVQLLADIGTNGEIGLYIFSPIALTFPFYDQTTRTLPHPGRGL